jgi:hypothetical protein
MPVTVRKKTPREPLPHPPPLPDVASVFEVELSSLGATRAKGTLADRLRLLDWLEEQPVRIVESLLYAPYFEDFAATWRHNEGKVAEAAEEALRALDRLDRALAESGTRVVQVGTSDAPGGETRELLAKARRVVASLGVPAKTKGRPSKSRETGSAGRVAVALEVLARAGLAGVPRRTIFEAKDPVSTWARQVALSLCGPDPDFRKRRGDALDQLEAALEDPSREPPGNLGWLLHPVLIPAVRETINTR